MKYLHRVLFQGSTSEECFLGWNSISGGVTTRGAFPGSVSSNDSPTGVISRKVSSRVAFPGGVPSKCALPREVPPRSDFPRGVSLSTPKGCFSRGISFHGV